MRIEMLLRILPVVATSLSLCASGAYALGSHQPQPSPTPQPVQGTTYLTPAYCLTNSSAAQDATETWVTITVGSGHHSTNLLGLQLITSANGFTYPYGLVTNTAHPTFSSLAFDATGNGTNDGNGEVDILVANVDGFLDEGFSSLSNLKAQATATTPSGYKHFLATPLNLDIEGPPFDQLATFVFADIYPNAADGDGPKNDLTLVNVSLNGSSTFATGVLATPSNNCQEFEEP